MATQIAAILICGFGILMPKLEWSAIAAVWAWCLAWMVVIDIAKLIYVRCFDHNEAQMRELAQPIAR